MDLNIPGLICLLIYCVLFLLIGVWAARKRRILDKHSDVSNDEQFLLSGRNLGWFLSSCTVTATFISGVHITYIAQHVHTDGFATTIIPWGFCLSLFIGGSLFAKKFRKSGYMTIIDPIEENYGKIMAVLLSIFAMMAELLWSAAMLGGLTTIMEGVLGEYGNYVVMVTALIPVMYTVIGGVYAVAITDVVQLCCLVVGIWFLLPFAMTNGHVTSITNTTEKWLGKFDAQSTGEYIDLTLVMILGSLPWQSYFQRVMSTRTPKQAQVASHIGAFGCLLMVVPGTLIGAVANSTDWRGVLGNSTTTLTDSGLLKNSHQILPFILRYITPEWVSFITIGGFSAAVMSSADSSFLSASTLFSHNIYKSVRKVASPMELIWVTRICVFVFGVMATALGITIKNTYELWILSSDFIYVILFPQFFAALYIKPVNIYGSFSGLVVGLALRLCGGVPLFKLPALIKYPFYDSTAERQLFPYRTLAMGCSLIILVIVSVITNRLEEKLCINRTQDEIDILKISYREPEMGDFASFSKITRWSGSYNSITASALELRNKEDKLLLKSTLVRNASALSNSRPRIDMYDERLEMDGVS